jgi:hypothetical protein
LIRTENHRRASKHAGAPTHRPGRASARQAENSETGPCLATLGEVFRFPARAEKTIASDPGHPIDRSLCAADNHKWEANKSGTTQQAQLARARLTPYLRRELRSTLFLQTPAGLDANRSAPRRPMVAKMPRESKRARRGVFTRQRAVNARSKIPQRKFPARRFYEGRRCRVAQASRLRFAISQARGLRHIKSSRASFARLR